MAVKPTYDSVTVGGNAIDVISLEVSEGYKQTCATCSIEVSSIAGLSLNDEIIIDIGYVGDHGQIFKGLVDEFTETRLPGTYTITGRDILKRAIEHFIVSQQIDDPWSRENISAENLVRDLLKLAGITNYSGAATSFTFGTQNPAEFNLMSSWDGVRLITHILAYTCYAQNGTVYFKRQFPVPAVSTHNLTVGNTGNILLIDYNYNTDNLRNKVVVFGYPPIRAEKSVASPHLPAGFYKTAIVSSELIDTQSIADSAASYNLDLYNKLTEAIRVELEGDYTIRCRDTVTVTEPFTGLVASDWFVFSASHRLDDSGYTLSLNLTR